MLLISSSEKFMELLRLTNFECSMFINFERRKRQRRILIDTVFCDDNFILRLVLFCIDGYVQIINLVQRTFRGTFPIMYCVGSAWVFNMSYLCKLLVVCLEG